jgi:hypothetical protein
VEIVIVIVVAIVVVIWWLWKRNKQRPAPWGPAPITVEPEPEPLPPVTRSGETIATNVFGRSDVLNTGKEGTIFEIPQHRLIDVEGRMLFKRLSEPSPDVRVQFDALHAFLAARSPDGREHFLRSTAWPLQLTQDGGIPNGFVMRRATDEFRLLITGPKGQRATLAEIQYLASHDSYLTRHKVSPLPTMDDRLAVLAELAELLAILHEGDAVYGDLSLVNLAYSVRPAGIFLLDCDSVRVPGSPATLNQLHANDFIPPRDENPATTATDVYKYACLAQEVLAQPLHAPAAVDKRERAVERMPGPLGESLLQRSMSPEPADRPSMREWTDFFSSAGITPPTPNPEGLSVSPASPSVDDDRGWIKNANGDWVRVGPPGTGQPVERQPDEPHATTGWVRDPVTGEWHRKSPDD